MHSDLVYLGYAMMTPEQPTSAFPQPPRQAGPYGPPPFPPAPPGYYPPPPPKKQSFWGSTAGILLIIFGSIAAVLVLCGGLATVGMISDRNAMKNIDVQVTSCENNGPVAKIGYTVKNSGKESRRVKLDIEYRDASGARLDTDTAYVGKVPAGDTVRGEESTILNAEATTITCKIVGVS